MQANPYRYTIIEKEKHGLLINHDYDSGGHKQNGVHPTSNMYII